MRNKKSYIAPNARVSIWENEDIVTVSIDEAEGDLEGLLEDGDDKYY